MQPADVNIFKTTNHHHYNVTFSHASAKEIRISVFL